VTTRKQEVLDRLAAARGDWVNGSELATAEVGGSEGLKRLRELRAEGYAIEKRSHPDPDREVYQYRLTTRFLDRRGHERWTGGNAEGIAYCPDCNAFVGFAPEGEAVVPVERPAFWWEGR
jgi:hypothetical protein